MYQPLVSIIIPVYNGANYLKESIESALNQTYKNIEILVVNDGSVDNGATEKIAQSYGDKIRFFHKKNGGVSSALNFGIKNMRGEWFSWLSHDDLYDKNKIQKQIELIEKNSIYGSNKIVVLSASELINEQGKKIFHPSKKLNRNYSGSEIFTKSFNSSGINGCSLLIPKSVFDKFGEFDTSYKYLQDMEYWVKLMLDDYIFVCHDDVLVRTRVHSGQITTKFPQLYYIENERLGNEVVKILSDCNGKNEFLLKNYLYTCCKEYNYKLYRGIVSVLKNSKKFSLEVRMKVWFYIIYGRVYGLVKKGYKTIFINKIRKRVRI